MRKDAHMSIASLKTNRQPWRNSQYKKIRQESEKRPRNPVRGVKPVKYIK